MPPLLRDRLLREDRRHRAGGLAVAALDADVRIDVEHFGRLELFLVLTRMDAVDRTHVHAGRVLRADAGLRDDVHPHRVVPPRALRRAMILPNRAKSELQRALGRLWSSVFSTSFGLR